MFRPGRCKGVSQAARHRKPPLNGEAMNPPDDCSAITRELTAAGPA